MKLECFTCGHKKVTEITKEERLKIKEINKANGRAGKRIPEQLYHCKVTGKQISQIDPACDEYKSNKEMVFLRKAISKTATKLRKELE